MSDNPLEHILSRAFYTAGNIVSKELPSGTSTGKQSDQKLDQILDLIQQQPPSQTTRRSVTVVTPTSRKVTPSLPIIRQNQGMGINNGEVIKLIAHLKQSISDVLLTPIGSRVMRRTYGSRLFDLMDTTMNAYQTMQIYAATAHALDQWEPRINLISIKLQSEEGMSGRFVLSLTWRLSKNYRWMLPMAQNDAVYRQPVRLVA